MLPLRGWRLPHSARAARPQSISLPGGRSSSKIRLGASREAFFFVGFFNRSLLLLGCSFHSHLYFSPTLHLLSVGQRHFLAPRGEHVHALHSALMLPLLLFSNRFALSPPWANVPPSILFAGCSHLARGVTLKKRIYCFAWRNPILRSARSARSPLRPGSLGDH